MKTLIITLLAVLSLQAPAADTCDISAIDAEMHEMRTSPYWAKQTKDFAEEMNRIRPRGCSFSETQQPGLDIFMDDLEFTGPHDDSRVLATSGHYEVYLQSKNSKNEIYVWPKDSAFYQSGVSEIRVYLQQGNMSLLARTCSPKVALANLIAYAPYALNAHCGENNQSSSQVTAAIESKVQEILNGER